MTVALTTLQILSAREDSATMLDLLGLSPATSGPAASDQRYIYLALARYFEACANGSRDCELTLMSETFTPALTISVTDANVDNGDTIVFTLSDGRVITLTWTTGTAGAYAPKKRSSDTTDAAELVSVINANPELGPLVRATNAVGVVTLTPRTSMFESGRSLKVVAGDNNSVVNVPYLAPKPRLVTFAPTFANITADDTFTISGVVMTFKASAGSEAEITIGGNLAAACTNIAAAINTHSKLGSLWSAVATTTTVLITSKRLGILGGASQWVVQSDATLMTITQAAAQSASPTVAFATTVFGKGL